MTPSTCTCAPVRPSAVVNAEIRRLAARIALSDAERIEMAGLWAEWTKAKAIEKDAELAA